MNTFNKKSLYAALAGLSALGATGTAQAVSVNPDGLGQALIYPYFTVREAAEGKPYNSLLTVVNSTASAKAVKVRFLEGKNSKEVLDFNLYLSAKDVWTAAIVPTAAGAAFSTEDLSCTTPPVTNNPNDQQFVNFAYVGDGADQSLDRTREGYVEIIEMGNIDPATAVYDSVTHVNGVPDCTGLTDAATSAATVTGNGGLFGTMTIVNVLGGADIGYDATALDGFSQIPLWFAPGSTDPNLARVNPKTSVVTSGTTTYITDWSAQALIDPVSAVLMHSNVYNEFTVQAGINASTDWVLTAPTKFAYIGIGPGTNPGRLFQRNFNGAAGSCDEITSVEYDREERQQQGGPFSPPSPTATNSICWEATVISMDGKNVLGSKNRSDLPVTFDAGWIAIGFNPNAAATAKHVLVGGTSIVCSLLAGSCAPGSPSTTFAGLPVIGFAVEHFQNGDVGGVLSNYAAEFNHKFTRSITP